MTSLKAKLTTAYDRVASFVSNTIRRVVLIVEFIVYVAVLVVLEIQTTFRCISYGITDAAREARAEW